MLSRWYAPSVSYSKVALTTHAIQVSVKDVGVYCASEAVSAEARQSGKPHVIELQGPRDYSSLDAQRALEEVTGKTIELRVVKPEDMTSFASAIFPPHVVPLFVEMNATLLPGSPFLNDPENDTPVHRGAETLTDAFRRMVQ